MTESTPTILCIDDDSHNLLTRKLLLESNGYHVLTAQSGSEGIRLFQSETVDAVILDYLMPGMNGLVVAHQLKDLSPQTPIIFLSAWAPPLDEGPGLAELWIRKGEEDAEYLLAKLKETLAKARQRSAHP
jgi:CheY-like chemotaxis protein